MLRISTALAPFWLYPVITQALHWLPRLLLTWMIMWLYGLWLTPELTNFFLDWVLWYSQGGMYTSTFTCFSQNQRKNHTKEEPAAHGRRCANYFGDGGCWGLCHTCILHHSLVLFRLPFSISWMYREGLMMMVCDLTFSLGQEELQFSILVSLQSRYQSKSDSRKGMWWTVSSPWTPSWTGTKSLLS